MKKKTFILASQSPRRQQLLEQIGAKFEVICGSADEADVPKELSPDLYVRELAVLKANSVAGLTDKPALIIGADTVVVSNGKILGKPSDEQHAVQMLRELSGETHSVYTGVAVADTTDMKIASVYERTLVTFRELSDAEIIEYVRKYRPFDKAGAYGIQEYAGVFVSRIDGDYCNVVGLPLCRLYTLIKDEFGEVLA